MDREEEDYREREREREREGTWHLNSVYFMIRLCLHIQNISISHNISAYCAIYLSLLGIQSRTSVRHYKKE